MKRLVKDDRRGVVSAFIGGFFLICIVYIYKNQDVIFYPAVFNNYWYANWPRYLWGITFGSLGFTIASFIASFEARPGELKYSDTQLGFYLGYCTLEGGAGIFGSILVVSLLNSLETTSRQEIFYIFSAALSFYIGLIADIRLLKQLLGKS